MHFICRLLQEEASKRLELEQIHLQQQEVLSQSQKEKVELEKEKAEKERALQAAQEQLENLKRQRQGAQEEYMVADSQFFSKIYCSLSNEHCPFLVYFAFPTY